MRRLIIAERPRDGIIGDEAPDKGDLQTDQQRQGGRVITHVTAVELVVDGVRAGRAHVDEHLARPRRG